MWMTLALAAVVSAAPGQPGQLTLSNVRSTHGLLGPTRADSRLLPGDMLVVTFDIDGVRTDPATGKVMYSTSMEVTDSRGQAVFRQAPRDLEAINSLGGTHLPANATINIGLDQPPGRYTARVTVTDRSTRASQSLNYPFEVLPRGFGLVRLNLSSDVDPEDPVPVPFPAEGQSLWLNFGAVGFGRLSNQQPDVAVEMRVLDESGRPTVSTPFQGRINQGVPDKAQSLPMQFLLSLNRPGKFTVELKATCQVSRKTFQVALPLTVLKAK
jgi:hypothetical protein